MWRWQAQGTLTPHPNAGYLYPTPLSTGRITRLTGNRAWCSPFFSSLHQSSSSSSARSRKRNASWARLEWSWNMPNMPLTPLLSWRRRSACLLIHPPSLLVPQPTAFLRCTQRRVHGWSTHIEKVRTLITQVSTQLTQTLEGKQFRFLFLLTSKNTPRPGRTGGVIGTGAVEVDGWEWDKITIRRREILACWGGEHLKK